MRIALPLAAACLAALGAHVAIDIAGDYLLPQDAYDAPAHGSRWLASIAFALVAAGGVWAILRATLAETRGDRGALRAALSAALPLGPWRFAGLVSALALPLLLGMARLDALCAGLPIDDAADLLGGSVPLGAGIALAFSLAAAAGVHRFVRLLSKFHRSILRVVEAFVRFARAASHAPGFLAASNAQDRPRVPAALARCTGANRAPPGPVGLTLPA